MQKKEGPTPIPRPQPMFGRPEDKTHGPNPFKSSEAMKYEQDKKAEQASSANMAPFTTDKLENIGPLKKHDKSYNT